MDSDFLTDQNVIEGSAPEMHTVYSAATNRHHARTVVGDSVGTLSMQPSGTVSIGESDNRGLTRCSSDAYRCQAIPRYTISLTRSTIRNQRVASSILAGAKRKHQAVSVLVSVGAANSCALAREIAHTSQGHEKCDALPTELPAPGVWVEHDSFRGRDHFDRGNPLFGGNTIEARARGRARVLSDRRRHRRPDECAGRGGPAR
jgi:hypothetical protein